MITAERTRLRRNNGDWFAKLGLDKRPSLRPAVTLDDRAQRENGLTARDTPAHAGTFQALGDEGFAGSFNDTTGNG